MLRVCCEREKEEAGVGRRRGWREKMMRLGERERKRERERE
jgi:hypothetical protein